MLMQCFHFFSELDFASLYEDRGLFSQMKCISAYKILLCACEESDYKDRNID